MAPKNTVTLTIDTEMAQYLNTYSKQVNVSVEEAALMTLRTGQGRRLAQMNYAQRLSEKAPAKPRKVSAAKEAKPAKAAKTLRAPKGEAKASKAKAEAKAPKKGESSKKAEPRAAKPAARTPKAPKAAAKPEAKPEKKKGTVVQMPKVARFAPARPVPPTEEEVDTGHEDQAAEG